MAYSKLVFSSINKLYLGFMTDTTVSSLLHGPAKFEDVLNGRGLGVGQH